VELCREGIEVSHRGAALFHRVPKVRQDKSGQKLQGLEMWLAKRPCHATDGLTDQLAGWPAGRLTD